MSIDRINEEIEFLIADLHNYHWQTRQRARESLVAIGEPAVAYLINALTDADRQVRWEAAKALSQIGDPAAATALVNALGDKTPGVRWLAAEGLIGMGREGLIPLLQTLVHHSDSGWLREGAHHVLREQSNLDLSKRVAPVLAALEDIEPVIQVPRPAQAALDALTESMQVARRPAGSPRLDRSWGDKLDTATKLKP
jgi:HEAT repeat protein